MAADQIIQLSDKLNRAADARAMATTPLWAETWDRFERELLERLLKCGPDDDMVRYRLQVAIEATRHVRIAIEHAGKTAKSLEKELDLVEGRKLAPIA